jgi:hypothetical protein
MELHVDYWEVVHKAPGGDEAMTNKLNEVCRALFAHRLLTDRNPTLTLFITSVTWRSAVKRCRPS